ncbi:unnamed protein product [Amoebophrya sp. A120]|nr:unnamed protein product [Amoebophrya sp. A120]|eukprot:GSA120T00017325001.1
MPLTRKDRTHHTGASNRETHWKPIKGVPTDFDGTMRSTLPREYKYHLSRNAPLMQLSGEANTDFEQTLAGAGYRKGETLTDTQTELFNQTRDLKLSANLATRQRVLEDSFKPQASAGGENADALDSSQKMPDVLPSFLSCREKQKLPLGSELLPSSPSKISAPKIESMKAVAPKLPHDKAQKLLPALQVGHHVLPGTVQSLPRWNARSWWEPLALEMQPKIKDYEASCVWNDMDSHYLKRRKGQDYLFRATRTQAEADAENEEAAKRDLNRLEEYYPRRELVDSVKRLEPGNDTQVRPVYLPDFAYLLPGRTNAEMKARVERLRGVLRQKYGGRPGLNKVFRAFANVKPGFLLPKDFHNVLDSMGIKTEMRECELLIQAVDRTEKGAITFEEFADLIYSPLIEVGRGAEDAVERHTQAITQNILDILVERGPYLGKAFCDVDPDRNYFISKEQFTNALGTACNHLSDQAIDFLWAAQFPISGNNEDVNAMSAVIESQLPAVAPIAVESGDRQATEAAPRPSTVEVGTQGSSPSKVPPEERLEMHFTTQTKAFDKKEKAAYDARQEKRRQKMREQKLPANPYRDKIDWTLFMKQLTDYVMSMRPMTPVYYQGKKRHYDLVQRTAALTGGNIPELDLNRPNMDAKTQIQIVADKLVMKERNLSNMPSEAAMQTVNYNEVIRTKAYAARRAIYHNISKDRFKYLCNNYEQIPRQVMIDILFNEIENPGSQRPYVRPGGSLPDGYQSPRAEVPEIERVRDPEHVAEIAKAVYGPTVLEPKGRNKKAAHILCQPADIEAWVGCEFGNNGDMVAPVRAWNLIEKQNEDLLAQFDDSKDGLNRALRQLRPLRQRPKDSSLDEVERKRLETEDAGEARTSASSTQDRRREKEEAAMQYQEDLQPEPAYRNYWQARFVMELIADGLEKMENGASGKLRSYKAFKRLDHDNDNYITLNDLERSFQQFKISYTPEDVHAVFSELDTADRGSVGIGQFSRRFLTFQGSLLDNMQKPIAMAAFDGTAPYRVGPVVERERAEAAKRGDGLQVVDQPMDAMGSDPGEVGTTPVAAADPGQTEAGPDQREEPVSQQHEVEQAAAPSSQRSAANADNSPVSVTESAPAPAPYEQGALPEDDAAIYPGEPPFTGRSSRAGDYRMKPPRYSMLGRRYGSITQVIKARTDRWKAKKHELYTTLPPGRYERTQYPETTHVTQPIPHESIASYLPEERRFKTMSLAHNVYAAPDPEVPARMDRLKSMAIRDFNVRRIQHRQAEISHRQALAEEAAREFEEKRIARKALNQLNYERKIRATY